MTDYVLQKIAEKSRHARGQSNGVRTNGGPAIEHITIGEDGHRHVFAFGRTAYGKGHVPEGGHKPITIVDLPSSYIFPD